MRTIIELIFALMEFALWKIWSASKLVENYIKHWFSITPVVIDEGI